MDLRRLISLKRLSSAAVCISAVIALNSGCNGGAGTKVYTSRHFPLPSVPAMVSSGQEAAGYVAMHYWDEFTDTASVFPCDSALVNGVKRNELEQAFADWLGMLQVQDYRDAVKAVAGMFDRIVAMERKDTSSNVFEALTELTQRYMYDPNSPLRNEDLYFPFVSRLASCGILPESERMAYAYDARMCSLNQTGTTAADFVFCDSKGRRYTLYGIKADYTLIFFSNPGCTACKQIMDALKNDGYLSGLVSSGKMAVANIYIDEDLTEWYKYMPVYPDSWYNGYDPDFRIRTELLYNVRAIPSLYLLDKDKNVIMKDAPEQRVFSFLYELDSSSMAG